MSFQTDICQLVHLTNLDIGWEIGEHYKNKYFKGISSLPSEIGNLTSLKYLNLSSNSLESLPIEFGNLTNLKSLKLSSNNFKDFPEELTKLTNLEFLDLSKNKLETLPNEIKNLTKLKKLDLRNNSISRTEIEKIYKLLPNCNVLYISDIYSVHPKTPFVSYPEIDTDEIILCLTTAIDTLQYYYDSNIDFYVNEYSSMEKELARGYNLLAWWQMRKRQFNIAEKTIRRGLDNVGLEEIDEFTNLPVVLLLQGKYQEAENIYKKESSTFECEQHLEALKILEENKMIPKEREFDIEKIRLLLTKKCPPSKKQ